MNILLAILFILLPAPIIWLNNRVKIIEKIGIVIICYALGMIVGNIGVIPESFSGIQTTIQDVSVCLALQVDFLPTELPRKPRHLKSPFKYLETVYVNVFCTVSSSYMVDAQ